MRSLFKSIAVTIICISLSACTTWSNAPTTQRPSTTRTTNSYPTTTPSQPPASNTPTRTVPADVNPVSGSTTQITESNVEDFYVVFGRRYAVMKDSTGFDETGVASWYGNPFHGRKTSNGEIYDMYQMTAAHKHLPLPTFVEVTRLDTGKSIVVRVNDRGPFKKERVIDLSYAAAQALDMDKQGTAQVRVRALDELNQQNEVLSQRQSAAPIFVQVGSYREMANAQNSQDLLDTINIHNTRIVKTPNPMQNMLYRLQVGPLTKGSEYDELIARLKTIGIYDTVIIRQ